CDGVAPFRPDGPLTPDNVRELRAAIERERTSDEPFDICLHGPREHARGYEAAGVTWYMESFFPEEPLDDVRRIIERGPDRT
ncbi:MAG: hypothetical protein QOI44_2350, partial [Actinomycetota bacterium]|nr:hypothetical protein [Actinomycetota bacterium]